MSEQGQNGHKVSQGKDQRKANSRKSNKRQQAEQGRWQAVSPVMEYQPMSRSNGAALLPSALYTPGPIALNN